MWQPTYKLPQTAQIHASKLRCCNKKCWHSSLLIRTMTMWTVEKGGHCCTHYSLLFCTFIALTLLYWFRNTRYYWSQRNIQTSYYVTKRHLCLDVKILSYNKINLANDNNDYFKKTILYHSLWWDLFVVAHVTKTTRTNLHDRLVLII